MAGVQTYLRNLALRVAYDATEVARGVDQTEADLQGLERTVDSSASSIDNSLSSVGDSASDTFDRGGTLDSALTDAEGTATTKGQQIGEGVAQGVSEGIETGDWGSAVQNTLASIVPGVGIAAGIGASIAGAMLFGMKRAADARRQEFVDAVNKAFDAIEVRANQSAKSINKAYLATLTFKDTLAEMGGGDADAGFRKVSAQAQLLGVGVEDIVNLINGQMTPGTIKLQEAMRAVTEEMENSGARMRENNGVLSATEQAVANIAGEVARQNAIHGDVVGKLLAEREAAKDIADYNERAASGAERMASAASRYSSAIREASGRRLPTDIAL